MADDPLIEPPVDPGHEITDHFVAWAGGRFDPAELDLGSVNTPSQQVRRSRKPSSRGQIGWRRQKR